jgi:hypothetical protein
MFGRSGQGPCDITINITYSNLSIWLFLQQIWCDDEAVHICVILINLNPDLPVRLVLCTLCVQNETHASPSSYTSLSCA